MEYTNFFVQNVALAIFTSAVANWVGERYGHHQVVFGVAVAGAVGIAVGWAYSRPGLSPWLALAVAVAFWIGIAFAMRRAWPLRRAAPEVWIRRATMQVDPNTHAGRAAIVTLGATHSMKQMEISDLSVGLIPLKGAKAMWLIAPISWREPRSHSA